MTQQATNGTALDNLTDAEIADLLVNFPHQTPLSNDQYLAWRASSYFFRHLFDNIGVDPFL